MKGDHEMDEPSLSPEEIVLAEKVFHIWKKRALFWTLAFLISCASVYPFSFGHPLHACWNSVGRYLVLLSMGLLIPFIICVGAAFNSWDYLRKVKEQ